MENIVIGANGLIGASLIQLLKQKGNAVLGTFNKRKMPGYEQLDILQETELKKILHFQKPKNIFFMANLAGGVNLCEEKKELASKFHFEAVKNITDVAKEIRAKLVFISTDYVFGDSDIPVKEQEKPFPLNYYGQLKAQAEKYIQDSLSDYLIIRTTNVYGLDEETVTPNFFMQVSRNLKNQTETKADAESLVTPTYVEDISLAIKKLIDKKQNGIFHIVGPESMTRFEWARRIATFLKGDLNLIQPATSANSVVKRPKKLILENTKVISTIDIQFTKLEQGFLDISRRLEGSL